MDTSDRYFIVTHRFNDKRFRAIAKSKNKLRKRLPRHSDGAGYMTLYDIEEVDLAKFRRMRNLKDAPYAK